ncbi:MAG TPA: PKD domain-containing protein, partial [Methanospirillum sp.]|nr:PKD domain-containing protein [Methanospirillum sp.]
SFTTSSTAPVAPIVQTLSNGTVTSSTAVLNGNLTSIGSGNCSVWFGYRTSPGGVLMNTTSVSKSSVGQFNATASGLNPGSTYYYSAFASNSGGTSNGSVQSFITSTLPQNYYLINSTAGSGGSISPSGMVNVLEGTSQTFIITPAFGYEISTVIIDDRDQGVLSSYTFSNVTTNHSIRALFRIPSPPAKYVINASSDAGSVIKPSGIVEVSSGGEKTFTIWPSANYQLKNVSIDGVPQGPIRSYTFTNITANHTISVTSTAIGLIAGFTGSPTAGRPPLTVNFTDNSFGNPSNWFWRFGDGTFSSEKSPHHTYTRSGVYTVSLTVKNSASSTIKTERNYITVSEQNWTISATAGTGGTISPNGSQTYPQGATQRFTLTPLSGYITSDLLVDGTSQGPQSSWTFTNIRQNHSLSATFSPVGGYTPEITGVHPDHGEQGTIRRDITITGTHIEDQASVLFTLAGYPNLTSSIVNTGQVLQVKELNLTTAHLGVYDVWVTNPGGRSGILAKSFTVTGPAPKAPVVDSVSPSSASEGATIPVFTITGQYFGGSDKIDFMKGGVSALSLPAIFSGTDLRLNNLSVASLSTGTFDIVVTNTTTGLKGTKEQAFRVGNLSASYVINATSNEYATIKPAGLITVRTGDTIEFTLQPKAGAGLSNLTVDSRQVTMPANKRYSFADVQSNHTIRLEGAPTSGVVLVSFIANSTSGSSPFVVQFTDTSSGNPNQWSWNFGDGQMARIQNPVHVYTRPGSYTVTLFAKNAKSNNMKSVRGMIHVTSAVGGSGVAGNIRSSPNSPIVFSGRMQNADLLVPGREILTPLLPF